MALRAALCRAPAEKALPIRPTASFTAAMTPPTTPPLAKPLAMLETPFMTSSIVPIASAMLSLPISSNIFDSPPAIFPTSPATSADASARRFIFFSLSLLSPLFLSSNKSFTAAANALKGFFFKVSFFNFCHCSMKAFRASGDCWSRFSCSGVMPICAMSFCVMVRFVLPFLSLMTAAPSAVSSPFAIASIYAFKSASLAITRFICLMLFSDGSSNISTKMLALLFISSSSLLSISFSACVLSFSSCTKAASMILALSLFRRANSVASSFV